MAGEASVALVFNLLRIGFFVCILIVIFNGIRSAIGLFGGGGRGMGNALQGAAGGIRDIADGGRQVGGAIGDEIRERRETNMENRLEQINVQLEERMTRLEQAIAANETNNAALLTAIDQELQYMEQLLRSRTVGAAPGGVYTAPPGTPPAAGGFRGGP